MAVEEMTFVANSLFEIISPDGKTLGFAACEEDADRRVVEDLKAAAEAYMRGNPRTLTKENLEAWFNRTAPCYKIVRVA
jgi:hypothetical protein